MIRRVRIWTGDDGDSLFEEHLGHGERGNVLSDKVISYRAETAGTRVQTIRPHQTSGWSKHRAGQLEFGTELVTAADRSMAVLLGASPGASTAAFVALEVLQACFGDELNDGARLGRLKQMIPTYGIDLKADADACRRTRDDTAKALKIEAAMA